MFIVMQTNALVSKKKEPDDGERQTELRTFSYVNLSVTVTSKQTNTQTHFYDLSLNGMGRKLGMQRREQKVFTADQVNGE